MTNEITKIIRTYKEIYDSTKTFRAKNTIIKEKLLRIELVRED